jgi:hypothetical protein
MALSFSSLVACTIPLPSGQAGQTSPPGQSGVGGGGDQGPARQTVKAIAEVEPNNGPDFAGFQSVGALDASTALEISGRIESGGVTGEGEGRRYSGDFDAFAFEVPAGMTLTASLDWEGSADLDAILYDANLNPIGGDNTTVKPISKSGALPAGKYAAVLYSKDHAASYKLRLSLAAGASSPSGGQPGGGPQGGTTCIDSALLSGGYWQATTGGLSQIHFKSNGGVDYGSANPVSGTVWASGTWELSCPTLTVTIKYPSSTSTKTFTVNGTRLVSDDGRTWVRCQPISNGQCF